MDLSALPRCIDWRGSADLARDAESSAELVIDEVRDFAATIATEAALSVIVAGQQRVLATGHQHVSLTAGFADERLAVADDRDDVVGSTLEAILADVFVQQAFPDALDEIPRWREPHEV